MQSAYTIKVSERQADGVRDVSVFHHGELHFSTSHQNMKWAVLTRFPAPFTQHGGSLHPAAISLPDEKCDVASACGGNEKQRDPVVVGKSDIDSGSKLMYEYLCVFHCDEPRNRLSHYTAHQPWTICSAYSTADPAAVTHFVLNNINPSCVVPGLRGVFVHGTPQSVPTVPSPLIQVGVNTFQPAADLWWMVSQLAINPVYVSVGGGNPATCLPTGDAAANSTRMHIYNCEDNMEYVAPKHALVGSTVLAQFQVSEDRMMVVAVGGNDVRLAMTTVSEHVGIMLWVWWPQRLHMPNLRVKGASVSLTVSESCRANVQVLFLFDASRGSLHVLRTPDLLTAKGSLDLLFTISTNCPPVVLPCMCSSMMQPIMVCNRPSVNEVALYYVPELLRTPLSTNYMATMSLSGVLPKNIIVEGVSYHNGSTVVFEAAVAGSDREPSVAASHQQYAFNFPSLLDEQHPLARFILEALEPVFETECVALLQCELLRRSWKSKRKGQVWDFGTGCLELIANIVHNSMSPNSDRRGSPSGGGRYAAVGGSGSGRSVSQMCDAAPSGLELQTSSACTFVDKNFRLCDVVADPILMTADTLQKNAFRFQDRGHHENHGKFSSELDHGNIWTKKQCGLCVFTLHLLYESLKLQERFWILLEPLARLNLRLSEIMQWSQYTRYYSTCLCETETEDFAGHTTTGASRTGTSVSFQRALPENLLIEYFKFHASSSTAAVMSGAPPLLYTILQRVLKGKARTSGGWPAIRGITSSNPLSLANKLFFMLVDCFDAPQVTARVPTSWWFTLCKGLLEYDIDPKFVSTELCAGVGQPIERALCIAKDHPDDIWNDDFNTIIGRLDRLQHNLTSTRCVNPAGDVVRTAQERAIGREYRATLNDDDGVIMRPDFPKRWGDSRLDIVQSMFNTAAPITLPSQVDGTDAIYGSLRNLSRRATALPVGRGMFTLCTLNFRVRDSVPIPPLNLEGRTSDGITITNNFEEAEPVNIIWPLFHNGCAAGLRFLSLPHFKGHRSAKEEESITRHWVLYQTRNISCPASRSGLLLAAGLLGHLKVLQRTDIYSLLVSPQSQFSGREAVTIAVLLGLSCSLRGTSNPVVFNCVSMHVQSLTPATEDIEVSLDVQTAASVSLGLLYQGTPDAFFVEMLLIQMSRLPSDEHFRDREGYALGAGFGLGLLLLGTGSSHGVPNVENRLLKFMEGARREAAPSACEGLEVFNEVNPDSGHFLTRAQMARNAKESFRNQSTRVYEGDCFNIAVSGPAAVVALGFIYLQTNDALIADKIAPPNRLVGLQGVFPELCLLRTMMSSLIMWSKVEPTQEWIFQNVPSCLLRLVHSPKKSGLAPSQIRYLTMNLGYCIAGAVLAMGMRFAGSMNADAKVTVLAELNGFLRGFIGSTKTGITSIQNSTGAFLPCISACAIALALVTAGTGDVQCLAVMQKLHKRMNVGYGDHLAISMATGLLFLGGGQLTLSNSLSSVAALIMAFYPVWPETASDNRMHLQALRHLYCLAVVPRLIETIDVLTNRPVSVPVRVIVNRGRLFQNEPSSVVKEMWTPVPKGRENQAVRMVTPCLLPELSTVAQIEIRSAQHYNMTICNMDPNVIGDGGIVVRVLEKNVTSTEDGKSGRSPGEELVVSWIQRLFHEQMQLRPGPIEAGVIIDNVNLLFTCQERFLADLSHSEREFSLDFIMNVRRTLNRRYSGLLRHNGRLSTRHPLSQLIMKQKSVYSTASSLVQTLVSDDGHSSDLAPIAEALLMYAEATGMESTGNSEAFHVSFVMQWLSQALHFYGLVGRTKPLSQLLTKYTDVLQRREQRVYALYRMNQTLLLRPEVLEDLVDCCVELAN